MGITFWQERAVVGNNGIEATGGLGQAKQDCIIPAPFPQANASVSALFLGASWKGLKMLPNNPIFFS